MARPLRIEFAGALYHVTSQGDGREEIYRDDDDRLAFLGVVGVVCERFNWVVHVGKQGQVSHDNIDPSAFFVSSIANGSGAAPQSKT